MLDGKTILIVEDEALLALDLMYAMEDMGARVVGPCYRLKAALASAREVPVDGAVLDVDLAGDAVFPLADELVKARVPFIFHTGRQNPQDLMSRYSGARVCPKPTSPDSVAAELSKLILERRASA
jgi:DNA-binding response OmpR family regulator